MLVSYCELYAYIEIAIYNVGLQVTKWASHLATTRIIKSVQTKDYNNSELSFVGKALKKRLTMACNFNCTQLFSLHLKGCIVTSNVLTLIHKQINKEMFLELVSAQYFDAKKKKVMYFAAVIQNNILLPQCLPFDVSLL